MRNVFRHRTLKGANREQYMGVLFIMLNNEVRSARRIGQCFILYLTSGTGIEYEALLMEDGKIHKNFPSELNLKH